MSTSTILLTGGTGRTGRRVAARLQHHHPEYDVRLASRTGSVPFDWDYPETWDANLADVDTVYLCYSPDLALPGVAETIEAFTARAVAHGVERLVLLSGRGEDSAKRCEQIVMGSGIDATVVRCAFFAQSFGESFLYGPIMRGRLTMPAGDVTEPFVDLEDVCDIITLALTEPGHAGKLYELTGPESLGFAEIAAELSQATGRKIDYEASSPEKFAADLAMDDFPFEDALALAGLFQEVLDGRNVATTTTIEQVLARPAGTFADYVRRTAATGIWSMDQPVAS